MELGDILSVLLLLAWLIPLGSFTVIVLAGPWMGPGGRFAGGLATLAIVASGVLSLTSLGIWLSNHPTYIEQDSDRHIEHTQRDDQASSPFRLVADTGSHGEHDAAKEHDDDHGDNAHGAHDHGHHDNPPTHYAGTWWILGKFGSLVVEIGYYIDALTILMFCVVTIIASCIHFYAMGYMHEELHDVTDHEVTLENGEHLHRPGRYHRFFQYLSLFCFSMLGLVIAGNIAMVFVFWELVGICSYFLIGFYVERKSASTAANKAFIVNRVGDFGMIIGLMIIWAGLGTFAFEDIFAEVRPADQEYGWQVPDGMVRLAAKEEIGEIVREQGALSGGSTVGEGLVEEEIEASIGDWREQGYGYWLMVIGGLGIFCGCVGKSAQFPLHTWLPDAMEGPTPVSALVHSATMVAAGVYLVGRFYPFFAPEVLLTIAYIGGFTLLMAATIAITATDIKRVLAYSTVSQLGYMMLALGVGGWVAGMFHLITHAFFKSLLFMCSGSVIHAVHTNEMTEMGGLLKKMPYTGWTMLVGCLAIIGAGVPFLVGFSGYYSKDAILEQALSFAAANSIHLILFLVTAGGAAITAFYMFRLWYMTFLGEPRDKHRNEHAHESPPVMYVPLIVLAVFAVVIGWEAFGIASDHGLLEESLLEQARPAGTLVGFAQGEGYLLSELTHPNEHLGHEPQFKIPATLIAFGTALGGLLLATIIYAWRKLDPNEIRQQFSGAYTFLVNKWYFDELYHAVFVAPTLFISRRVAQFDKRIIDGIVDGSAYVTRWIARIWDSVIDRFLVDGSINLFARRTWSFGVSLHRVQTGHIRQYVMFIVVGTVALFVLISFFVGLTQAG